MDAGGVEGGNEAEELGFQSELVEIEAGGLQEAQSTNSSTHAQAAAEIFLEFIEVAIHQILHGRNLYPAESFLDRKKYSIPVHISCHPGLNNYILDALNSLRGVLRENKICHISILVKDGSEPLEKFLFELNLLQKSICKEQEYAELEQSLRSFLVSLMSCSASLGHIPATSSFEIMIECNDDCELDLNMSNDANIVMWTKVDKADFVPPMEPARLIPVKALTDSSVLSIQLIVEQMKPHRS